MWFPPRKEIGMIPQTTAAVLLAIPLVVMVIFSIRYWAEYRDSNKGSTAKPELPYNKLFLSLVGLGFFCMWPFWIGGTILLFLNTYYSELGFLGFSSRFTLDIQVIGFMIFYAGAILLNWALFVAGKYLRPSTAGV